MSTGMSNIPEIIKACEVLEKTKTNISLLHCVSAYPTKEAEANIKAINTLQSLFPKYIIGHSDHTPDIKVPLYAVASGAKVLEKHFMIEKDCVDAPVSIDENMMTNLVSEVRLLEKIIGNGTLGMTKAQEGTKIFRRYGE
jgi:sialic acid synthase SpsE